MKWYIWACNTCSYQITTNRFIDEEGYERIKDCGCKEKGTLEYKDEYEDGKDD